MPVTDRTVALVLRVLSAIDLFSLGAAVVPFAWMERIHARLGLGTLPHTPVVEYLARGTSIFYGLHAALVLFLSTDVPRYRPAIAFLAWAALAHGALLLWTDLRAGMPPWWTAAEPAGLLFEGVLVLTLLRAADRHNPHRPPGSSSQ